MTTFVSPNKKVSVGVTTAVGAALCFGFGNLAYRYGDGNALAIAASRCLVGVLLISPVLLNKGLMSTRAILNSRIGWTSVTASAVNLVISAIMLRTLTGPQAGLAIATVPLFVLATRRFFVQHRPIPTIPLAICVVASTMAILTGGLGEVTTARVGIVVLFVIINSIDVLLAERARIEHAASTLVALSMAVGAILGYSAILIFQPEGGMSTTGVLVAVIVGATGTSGRWLRGIALPFIGAAVVSSTAQIAALITAVGGIVLLHDSVRWYAVCLSLVAAASSFTAVIAANRLQTLSNSNNERVAT